MRMQPLCDPILLFADVQDEVGAAEDLRFLIAQAVCPLQQPTALLSVGDVPCRSLGAQVVDVAKLLAGVGTGERASKKPRVE